MEDVAKLNWLPVNKNVELNILKSTHKSLYNETFPEYLKLNLHKVSAYSLRSSICPFYSERIKNISTLGSNYFVAIRNITEYNSFCRGVKRHLLCKEL